MKQQPGMRWFRIYSEIKDDPKMLCLTDHQFRLWVGLLCMGSEGDDRGIIPPYPIVGLAASLRTTEAALTEALDLFASLDMIDRYEDGAIELSHFLERQYDNPSDQPERTRERKRRQRSRDTEEGHEDVTSESRASHDTEERREEEKREEEILTQQPTVADVSEPAPLPAPVSKPTKPTRDLSKLPRNQAMYAVLRDAWGIPRGEEGNGEKKKLNAAIKDIGPKWTVLQVEEACVEFRRRWPEMEFSPHGVATNMHTLMSPPSKSNGKPSVDIRPGEKSGWEKFAQPEEPPLPEPEVEPLPDPPPVKAQRKVYDPPSYAELQARR